MKQVYSLGLFFSSAAVENRVKTNYYCSSFQKSSTIWHYSSWWDIRVRYQISFASKILLQNQLMILVDLPHTHTQCGLSIKTPAWISQQNKCSLVHWCSMFSSFCRMMSAFHRGRLFVVRWVFSILHSAIIFVWIHAQAQSRLTIRTYCIISHLC